MARIDVAVKHANKLHELFQVRPALDGSICAVCLLLFAGEVTLLDVDAFSGTTNQAVGGPSFAPRGPLFEGRVVLISKYMAKNLGLSPPCPSLW